MANAAVLDKLERGQQLQREGIIIRTWDLDEDLRDGGSDHSRGLWGDRY